MTDTSFPLVKPVNGPDHIARAPLTSSFLPFGHQHYAAPPVVEGIHENDGEIYCVCGYADDDGSTVLCEGCNRWQHIVCYYPHYENRNVPDDLQHFCVDCKHQTIDTQKARSKQQARRGHTETLLNGNKRTSSKAQKKKTKEPGVPYTNGWPMDKSRHDRNSASPRDQPPPAKRPKTSHRTSDSTTVTTNSKGHSRKRNLSNVHHVRSASRSPDTPVAPYSDEFLRCCDKDEWDVTQANLFNSIDITKSLSTWLSASEEDFKEEHGFDKTGVLMRWDGDLDDIPGRADIEILSDQDNLASHNGQVPSWKYVTVKEPIANGAYIGEIKGHVGFKKEYQDDASNRWAQLRHPEPFVFFHPKLPIVIDARNEGTELRYVRRSCNPNARLQILVTDGTDYHFCFMAMQQIEPGDEVAIGWDTAIGLPELASQKNMSHEDIELFASWVSTALANCGPCACLPENECLFSRFDRRLGTQRGETQSMVKVPKAKKRKNHVSPLNTSGINSRSGSEIRKVDPDDEPTDSRSASGSAGRGSASRDITPNTHYSTSGSLAAMPELSERERKKLAKEEEMFRRQEEERAMKQVKKKRNSGGSNMNTPSASSSKQFAFPPASNASKYVDAGTNSRQTGQLTSKPAAPKRTKSQKTTPKPAPKVVKRVKYVDASTQCDLDDDDAKARAATMAFKRPFVSHRQRLLERVARNNSLIHSGRCFTRLSVRSAAAVDESKMEIDLPTAEVAAPIVVSSIPDKAEDSSTVTPAVGTDTEMPDLDANHKDGSPLQPEISIQNMHDQADSLNAHSPRNNSPAPSWLAKPSPTPEPVPSARSNKPVNMHLQMPPPQTNPFTIPLSAGTPTGTLAQSPASVTGSHPIFSPSVAAGVQPSPARKSISLSDYTRRKAKDKDNEAKVEREGSPASTASGPVVPPLQPTSSSEAAAAEGGSAIEDDVRMEDAGDKP